MNILEWFPLRLLDILTDAVKIEETHFLKLVSFFFLQHITLPALDLVLRTSLQRKRRKPRSQACSQMPLLCLGEMAVALKLLCYSELCWSQGQTPIRASWAETLNFMSQTTGMVGLAPNCIQKFKHSQGLLTLELGFLLLFASFLPTTPGLSPSGRYLSPAVAWVLPAPISQPYNPCVLSNRKI